MSKADATRTDPASPHRRRWLARGLLGVAVLLFVAGGAAIVFLASPAGVDFVVRALVARTGGALSIEGASGSLFDTVNLRRVEWHGRDTHTTADEVALTWNPLALFSRGIVVRGLGAKRLSIETKASTEDVPMPSTLALPIEVRIDRLGIAELEWRVGTNGGTIRGLSFGYRGGADGHRVSDLTFVAPMGAITGNATIGSAAPFAIAGKLHAKGDAALAGTEADVAVGGSLATLTLDATGNAHNAPFTAHATLGPLAAVPWRDVAIDAKGIDLNAWQAVLPATNLDVVVRASPATDGIAGTIDAINNSVGAVDAKRIPLSTVSGRFALRNDGLALDSIVAVLEGGGNITGSARIPLGDAVGGGAWTLELRDIDAHRIYAALVTTRLSGTVVADLDREQQRFRGNVTDRTVRGGIGMEFSAVLANDVLVVDRFRARSGKGELVGRGRMTLVRDRAFEIDATATSFDPAAYGAFPNGSLNGRIAATGSLAPALKVRAEVALAQGSRLSGVALAGAGRGTFTEKTLRDIVVELAAGHSKLTAAGAAGAAGDHLMVAVDSPDLADFAPLLPARFASSLAGALRLNADFAGLPPQAGLDLEASGERLKLPGGIGAGTAQIRAHIAPATSNDLGRDLATRRIDVTVVAKEVATPSGNAGTLNATVAGTLAEHTATLAAKGAEFDARASVRGGFDMTRELGDIGQLSEKLAWKGTLDAFENHGAWTTRLAAPARLEFARSRVRIGAARLQIADGNFSLAEFDWNDGRIATAGEFAAVPLATFARLAGTRLPFTSTLTLSGEWKIAATPHLNGTVVVRRQGGDIAIAQGADADRPFAVGISALEARARFDDDAVDASGTFRSARGDHADAKLAVGRVAGAPPGRLAPDAPLEFSATGDIPTLQILQPWIGSAAVISGRAHLDFAARGTVKEANLSGAFVGESLRIDAPRYGVHYTNGRIAVRADHGRVAVDEMTLTAGDGTFRASGEITGLAPGGDKSVARLTWKAQKFRALNRPDLHLIVGGEGTAVAQDGKIRLAGKLAADEGAIVYVATPDATLGNDVVVKGWKQPEKRTLRFDDIPLVLDVSFDLGDHLTFSGEGIETRLAGAVRVTTGPSGLVGKGLIRTVRGTYFAFGQRLDIDRGQLVFDGPLDNPGLDIVALRRNLAVEAGVAVTGTVKVPVIQLTSNPPVPDSEKLSWLVLGQAGGDRSTGADLAALQAASAALLGSGGKPISASIAQSIGLDDISLRSTSHNATPGAPAAENQVIAVGKRLTDRLTLVYEQGLTLATQALRLEYELTRSLTIRAEAGTYGALGIYFRRTFD